MSKSNEQNLASCPDRLLQRHMARSAARNKKVLQDIPVRQMVLRHWSMTIADVYLPDNPGGATDRVKTWARIIRSELYRP